MVYNAKPKQDFHKRILSMPNYDRLLIPKPITYKQVAFRSLTPSQLIIPKISNKSKNQKSIEQICLSPEISIGITCFSKVKVPTPNSKSEFLFKILNKNSENLESKKKFITVNKPPRFVLERKNNFGYSRANNFVPPKKTMLNESFNSLPQNSSPDKPRLLNSTQNEIFSTFQHSFINKQELVPDNIPKKLVVRPRYSSFIFEPVNK